MNRKLVHRGPDSEGYHEDGRFALGVRRLKIIDLETGDQPIFNENRQMALVLNGEIYNYRELRLELETLGHFFATKGDAEVIVHAYEEWGRDCLTRLRGMFAFALYDRRDQGEGNAGSLVLVRDRLGIKPLYVWQDAQHILFASEVRALLASGCVPRKVSPAGLYTFLGFGSVQEPLTVVDGILSLAPGSWMQVWIGRDGLQCQSGSFWQPSVEGARDPDVATVRQWLTDAVTSHLVSDVPLGAFLSGGLDSGAIVALGTRELDAPLRTFTLAFDGWPGDEREYALSTARRWKSEHQVHVVTHEEVLTDLPRALGDMDQPSFDGINTWYVSREARRAGLKVALSGVGGDELFAGYPSFRYVPRLKRAQSAFRWLPRGEWLEDTFNRLPGMGPRFGRVGALLAGRMFFDHPYFAVRGLFAPSQVSSLLAPAAPVPTAEGDPAMERWYKAVQDQLRTAAAYDEVNEVSWLELSQYMRSTLLRDCDTMSMAHSLEVRVPFVDHLLVDRVLPVRGKRKIDSHQPKPLLVGALADGLPREITSVAKRTFTFPFEQWLRRDLAAVVKIGLETAPDRLGSWLDPAAIRRLWSEFEHGRIHWSRPWTLFVLSEWARLNL